MKIIKLSQSVNLSNILSSITSVFKKRYTSIYDYESASGLFEDEDGNFVEVTITPIRYGKYSDLFLKSLLSENKNNEYHKLKSYIAKHTPQDIKESSSKKNKNNVLLYFVQKMNAENVQPNDLVFKLDKLKNKIGLKKIKGHGPYVFSSIYGNIRWENGKWEVY